MAEMGSRMASNESDVSDCLSDCMSEEVGRLNMGRREGDDSFESEWGKLKDEILGEERAAMEQRQRSPSLSHDNVLENSATCISMPQANSQHSKIREEIALAPEPRDAKSIARRYEGEINPSFYEGWKSRQCMYDVLCHKFSLGGPETFIQLFDKPHDETLLMKFDLALRLMNTRGKPIYHITPDGESFWGTPKVPNSDSEIDFDCNWNGRILAVIRHKLLQAYNLKMAASQILLNTFIRRSKELVCPVPEISDKGFLPSPLETSMVGGTTVAGRFLIIKVKNVDGGAYSGTCYLCEDKRAREHDILFTVKTFLTERVSLSTLKDRILIVFHQLIEGSQPAWGYLLDEGGLLSKIQRERFPNVQMVPSAGRSWALSLSEHGLPDWWLELCLRLEKAKQTFHDGYPLLSAHLVRSLLHAPQRTDAAKTVFLKTFSPKCNEGRALREIMLCSSKTPDLTTRDDRERLCNHEGLSAILGASTRGLVVPPPPPQHNPSHGATASSVGAAGAQVAAVHPSSKSTAPATSGNPTNRDRVAFVVLEYCTGIDLFNLCGSKEWKLRCNALLSGQGDSSHLALVRAISQQITMAVAHLHRSKVTHGDLKVENIMISSGGRVRLIDYGFMAHLTQNPDDSIATSYSCPEMHEQNGRTEELLKKNDVWMLAHVHIVLLLGLGNLPADGNKRFYGQNEGPKLTKSFDEWLKTLRRNVTLDVHSGIQQHLPQSLDLLRLMYAPLQTRCIVREPLRDCWWHLDGAPVSPCARPNMPHDLAPFFEGKHVPEGSTFAPDLLVVPLESACGWLVARAAPEGSISASSCPSGMPLKVGDLILKVDGKDPGGSSLPVPDGWLGEYKGKITLRVERAEDQSREDVTLQRLVDVREVGNLLHRDDRLGDGAADTAAVPYKFRVAFARHLQERRRQGTDADTRPPSGGAPPAADERSVPWAVVEASWTEFEAYKGESGASLLQVLHIWEGLGWARGPLAWGLPVTLGATFEPKQDEARRGQVQERARVEAALQPLLGEPPAVWEVRLDGVDGFGRLVAHEFARRYGEHKFEVVKVEVEDCSTPSLIVSRRRGAAGAN